MCANVQMWLDCGDCEQFCEQYAYIWTCIYCFYIFKCIVIYCTNLLSTFITHFKVIHFWGFRLHPSQVHILFHIRSGLKVVKILKRQKNGPIKRTNKHYGEVVSVCGKLCHSQPFKKQAMEVYEERLSIQTVFIQNTLHDHVKRLTESCTEGYSQITIWFCFAANQGFGKREEGKA